MKTKVKPFIYSTPSVIKDIAPIKQTENKYGVTIYFYLIDNSNLLALKNREFLKDFKENKEDDFKWFLDRWAVSIVSNASLLNKWLKKDLYLFLREENWTNRTVLI